MTDMRVKMEQILNAVERLNEMSKKKYTIYGAYGKVQLCVLVKGQDAKDGASNITPFLSKRELLEHIETIARYLFVEGNDFYKTRVR